MKICLNTSMIISALNRRGLHSVWISNWTTWEHSLRNYHFTYLKLISHWTYGRRFTDDIFKWIFVNEKFYKLIKISLNSARKGLTDNNIDNSIGLNNGLATSHYLNQCWTSSLTHICGTRGTWVKTAIEHILTYSSNDMGYQQKQWRKIVYFVFVFCK